MKHDRDTTIHVLLAKMQATIDKLQARIVALETATQPKPKRKKRPVMTAETKLAHAHMTDICQPIADLHRVTLGRIRSHDRRMVFMRPRYEAYAACLAAGYSSTAVGQFFGGRDHSTILEGAKKAGK